MNCRKGRKISCDSMEEQEIKIRPRADFYSGCFVLGKMLRVGHQRSVIFGRSLISKRLDRIKLSGPPSWHVTKEHTYDGRE